MKLLGICALGLVLAAGPGRAAKNLEVFFIDVEGGAATLVAGPGESLLIDTGYSGHNHRDAERIAAAAKAAGVKKIDYLLITHYHEDHAGGVPQLMEKLPVHTFVDHGPTVETSKQLEVLYKTYEGYRQKGAHLEVKPGDRIPVKGLDVEVVSAAGKAIGSALAGAGQANPDCAGFQKQDDDKSENAQSVGVVITYNKFRMVDLGDLTWNKEYDLVCPANKLGTADVYVVSHHGTATSGSPQLLHAIHPRVAIMENGPRKGGSASAWQIIHDSPGLQDLWQLHFAVDGGKEHNSADQLIANVEEICEAKWIRLTVRPDGSFTVFNSRNKFERQY
jgi:beta-lactamase superfamily II metal-dependent hydrolase